MISIPGPRTVKMLRQVNVHASPTRSRRGPRLRTLLLAILAFGVAARLARYLLNFPLWGDEAFVAVNFLIRDYVELVKPLLYNQIVPLVFMWVELAATQAFGLSEYSLRLLPIVAGIGSLFLFWRFLTQNFDRRTAVLALGFLAAAYYPIRHAAEVKPYSTDLFLSLVMIVVTTGVLRRPRSLGAWFVLLVLAPAMVWWSYPAIFLLAAIGCVLLCVAYRERRALVWLAFVYFCASVLLSFGVMYFQYAKVHAAAVPQITAIQMWDESFPPPITRPVALIWWLISIHAGNMLAYPVGGKTFGSIITTALVVIGALQLGKRRGWRLRVVSAQPDPNLAQRRLMLLLFLGPLPFNLVAAALEKYPYGSTMRISLYLAPAFCTLAGLGGVTAIRWFLAPRDRRLAFQIAAGSMALIAGGITIADVAIPYKKEANYEARRVVRELGERIAPTDQVVVLNALQETPHLPYIKPWKGDGAQFIYYLSWYVEPKLRAADPGFPQNVRALAPDRGKIRWAPPVSQLAPASQNGTTWLLFFHGGNYAKYFDSEQIDAYIAGASETLGPPEKTVNELQWKRTREGENVLWQQIDVYRFPPRTP